MFPFSWKGNCNFRKGQKCRDEQCKNKALLTSVISSESPSLSLTILHCPNINVAMDIKSFSKFQYLRQQKQQISQFLYPSLPSLISVFSKKYSQMTRAWLAGHFIPPHLESSVLFYVEMSDSHCDSVQVLRFACLHSCEIVSLLVSSSYVEGQLYLCAWYESKKSQTGLVG